MIDIQTANIENINKTSIYNLNYPYITNPNNLFTNINNSIYQDIISFKEVVEEELKEMLPQGKFLCYVNTEYEVALKKDNLLSIYIEFSQLAGLYNINYINTYNYDIELEKEITLQDIFINDEYENIIYSQILDYGEEVVIYEDQTFYIEEDGIVICFSTYELSREITEVTKFKIYFKDYREYLSKYALKKFNIN